MASSSRTKPTQVTNADDKRQPWRRAFYSIEQIKQLASISRTTVYREAHAGRLKLSKLAGRTGALDENFMAWLMRSDDRKEL
jgi:carboxypeptidase C (cathepsin A)